MTDEGKFLEIELKLFAAIEGIHAKLDASMKMQGEHAQAVRKYADDMIEVKQRQNRHGAKIREERRRREALEVWLGYPHTTAPRPVGMPVLPAGIAAWAPRPPAPSQPEEDELEDTKDHVIPLEDRGRMREILDRDRKDSEWRRTLPREALLRGFYFATAMIVAAAFTYLISHR